MSVVYMLIVCMLVLQCYGKCHANHCEKIVVQPHTVPTSSKGAFPPSSDIDFNFGIQSINLNANTSVLVGVGGFIVVNATTNPFVVLNDDVTVLAPQEFILKSMDTAYVVSVNGLIAPGTNFTASVVYSLQTALTVFYIIPGSIVTFVSYDSSTGLIPAAGTIFRGLIFNINFTIPAGSRVGILLSLQTSSQATSELVGQLSSGIIVSAQ